MARKKVDTQKISVEGTMLELSSPASDGDVVDSGRVALFVYNDSGSAVDVTVRTTASVNGLDVEDDKVSIPDGDMVLIGPFSRATFGRDSDSEYPDKVHVDYSAVTDVRRTVVTF